MRVRTLVNLFFLFSVTIFTQCTKHPEQSVPLSAYPTLRWATKVIPDHLDWSNCRTKECLQISSLIMTGLTRLEWKNGSLVAVPNLAKEWKWLTPLVLEVKLRPNIQWSNGESLVAQNVVWGIERAKRLKSPTAVAFLAEIKSVRAKKSDTVQFHMTRPRERLPEILSHPVTYPVARDTKKLPLVTLGAYEVDQFSKGMAANLRRNPRYSGVLPKVERVELSALDRDAVAENLFRDNDIDFWDEAVVSRTAGLETSHLTHVPGTSTLCLVINPQAIPDLHQRTTIFKSIDRQEPLQLFRWQHRIAQQILPLNTDGKELSLPPFDSSVRKSVFPYTSTRLTIGHTLDPWHQEVVSNLTAQLAKNLGVQLEPSKENWAVALVEFIPQPHQPLMGLEFFLDRFGESASSTEEAENLLAGKRMVLPLYRRVLTTLQRGSSRFLTLSPLGLWEVGAT